MNPLFPRRSGVLLHPTSFPSKLGIGDLGANAYKFIDFLAECDQTLWQILPIGPTGYGNAPYSNLSTFAGNEMLIDLENLVERGLLDNGIIEKSEFDSVKVEYHQSRIIKTKLLKKAFDKFSAKNEDLKFMDYVENNKWWLVDYSLYRVLKEEFREVAWNEWPEKYKSRDSSILSEYLINQATKVKFYQFAQYIFDEQWSKLKQYANEKQISIIGDIPIYVAYDSVDTWANQDMFELDNEGKMIYVSGCPPDHFSDEGQRWGTPIYRWDFLEKSGFDWWVKRIKRTMEFTDIVRIDHFRGLEDFWRIPENEKTAVNGIWVDGPSNKLLDKIEQKLGKIPIIAEDLGILSDGVYALRDKFNLPGMKILQYAFNPNRDATNHFLPHNHRENFAVYSGSHDNDTILGWFNSIDEQTKSHFKDYMNSNDSDPIWDMIQLILCSIAHTAIITLQDLLGLDTNARMNLPGTTASNWEWKYFDDDLEKINKKKLKQLTQLYGRKIV